jgi:mRNA interferase YafQ
MRRLQSTRQFERDLRRAKRRGKRLAKLWTVVDTLCRGDRLERRHGPHKLAGQWSPFRECHIEDDWLLIWRETDDTLILVRTGTHTDLFD